MDGNTTGNDYIYDKNGNMIQDKNKGITSIEYNYLNLPDKLTGNNKTIEYIYSANGQKLQKKAGNTTTHYSGSFIYEGTSLKQIIHGEGYVDMSGTPTYHYYLKDHLGNNRMVVNQSGTVVQQTDYYPFGMAFNKGGSADNKYLYNGKELQEDAIGNGVLDWLDYGARMYDPALGRFHTQDAFAEKYYDFSPYQYGANNPIKNIDVNGDSIWSVFDKNSNTLYVVDYDHYQKGLPVYYASPDDYEVGGIYDKDGNLAVNQVLVIEGVFTGGQSGEDGITYGNDDNQLPIPNGSYEILDYNSDNPSHKNWYRVDAIDSKPRNDINDNSEHRNSDGQLRRNFRAHVGGVSWGCVTFDENNENAVKGYNVFSRILQSTSTRQVRDRMGLKNSLGINNTSVTRYGTVKVR